MTLTTSERIIVDQAAYAAAKAVVKDVLTDITRIVENAVEKASTGDDRIVKLLDVIANAQVSAAGSYAATLKAELAAARRKKE
jgi:hypothetical protein